MRDEVPTQPDGPERLGGFLSLHPGQPVGNGRYVLRRPLGEGGMGTVWLAHDEILGELVALKFLPAHVRSDPAALGYLRDETLQSRRLAHPNIVKIFNLELGAAGESFIAMEYVDGATLSALRLEQKGAVFGWPFLEPLVKQLCGALDYAHNERVIHRDLKPTNVMLDAKSQVKLADFGIARVMADTVSRAEVRRSVSGTLMYMSPQQLEGKSPRPTDDIYSLGATLYELLSGRPPFYSGDVLHQVLHVEAEPIQQRLADLGVINPIPFEVRTTINDCLSKRPLDRPQSARELEIRLGLSSGVSSPRPKARAAQVERSSARGEGTPSGDDLPTPPGWGPDDSEIAEPSSQPQGWRALWLLVVLLLAMIAAHEGGLLPARLAKPLEAFLGRPRLGPASIETAASSPVVEPPAPIVDERRIDETGNNPAPESTQRKLVPSLPDSIAAPNAVDRGWLDVRTAGVYPSSSYSLLDASGQVVQSGTVAPPGRGRGTIDGNPGRYTLVLNNPAWKSELREMVTLSKESTNVFDVVLVEIQSEPEGGTVWSGGRTLGVTPLRLPVWSEGLLEYELRLPNHEPKQVRRQTVHGAGRVYRDALQRRLYPETGLCWTNGMGMAFAMVSEQLWVCLHEARWRDYTNFYYSYDTIMPQRYLLTNKFERRFVGIGLNRGGNPDQPIVNVRWRDAVEFCRWLTYRDHSRGTLAPSWAYRLPSDAEWSMAAGLGVEEGSSPMEKGRTAFNRPVYAWGEWGANTKPPATAGNFGFAGNDAFTHLAPVLSLATNRFGLHHMTGNVWEWCEDAFGGSGPGQDASARRSSQRAAVMRTLRGGSYLTADREHLALGFRLGLDPEVADEDKGFRIVLGRADSKAE